MADGIIVKPATTGVMVQTDLIGQTHYAITKMAYGDEGNLTLVSAANPLPVTMPTLIQDLDAQAYNINNVGQLQVATIVGDVDTDQHIDMSPATPFDGGYLGLHPSLAAGDNYLLIGSLGTSTGDPFVFPSIDNRGSLGAASKRWNQAHVGNLKLTGNTLSSIDTNGDISIQPDGSGELLLGNNTDITKIVVPQGTSIIGEVGGVWFGGTGATDARIWRKTGGNDTLNIDSGSTTNKIRLVGLIDLENPFTIADDQTFGIGTPDLTGDSPVKMFFENATDSLVLEDGGNGGAFPTFFTNFRIDDASFVLSDGIMQIGANPASAPTQTTFVVSREGTTARSEFLVVSGASANDNPTNDLRRARGTFGSEAAVVNADRIATIAFYGYDGTSYQARAGLRAIVNGTVVDGTNSVPMDLLFFTGITTFAERLRIMANGDVRIESGVLQLKEIATPTATTNYGNVYTKNDNKLYFQDGAGTEHEIAFV